MSFDPCNCFLKIWESIGNPTPKVGVQLGVWGFILSHSFTLLGTWNVTPGLHFWPAPSQPLALVVSPRLRLQHTWICLQACLKILVKFITNLLDSCWSWNCSKLCINTLFNNFDNWFIYCRNPYFEESVRMRLTHPEWELGSPPGLPKLQSSIAGVKTPRIVAFFISLEIYWNVDVENGLAWAIWTSVTQVMAKRKVGSQTNSLTPDH
jgi:hypothetical protein